VSSKALLPHQGTTGTLTATEPHGTAARRAGQVLLLAPSRGLGGGIERYVEAVQSAFDDTGVASRRLDLARSGLAGHRALLAQAMAALAGIDSPTRVIIAHRALLPVATVLAHRRKVSGISVICHGSDAWGSRWAPRRRLESRLMRRDNVRIVAVSSFTAGVLFPGARASILPPGLSRAWFRALVSAADQASAAGRSPQACLEVMTAFRLQQWRDKGLPQLTAAIAALGRADIRLTVCGSGQAPADLLAHVRRFPWCALRPGSSDAELAARFARASLFVLATRTRPGRRPSGEGFGLVLIEAQVAGTAVVGPAYGGSPDAYLDGVTGATPRDESVAALAQALDELVSQPVRLGEMGKRGASWARTRFAPDRYAALAVDRLL
jgi:glycosyltransferase involved in cell wall biosynthesis